MLDGAFQSYFSHSFHHSDEVQLRMSDLHSLLGFLSELWSIVCFGK